MGETYEQSVIRGAYFPHVDGLRALAVLAVVAFHLQAACCPGGYTGVDVFFVISGYLITGGIIRDLRRGTFSMADFYTRRVKRIMPAYFAMIIISLLVGLIFFHYEPLASLGNAASRSSYFFANFFCYKFLGGYFVGDGATHPLMNLWSLSVEEQFYIVIPLVLLLLWKWKRKLVVPAVLVLMIISLADAERMLFSETAREHTKAFYFAESRAWELLSGGLLAWFPHYENGNGKNRKNGAAAASLFGLATIAAVYVFWDASSHFPGIGALPSVLGACLIIYYGAHGPVNKLLSWGPIVGIGRISYSLYLWHWPIIAFMRYFNEKALTMPQIAFAAVLSFLFAYLSWRFVEMPVRRSKWITFAKAMAGLATTCILVGVCGSCFKRTNGLVHVIHQEANQYASLEFPPKLEKWEEGNCGITQLALPDEKGRIIRNTLELVGSREGKPDFLVLGDSHAEALKGGLNRVCQAKGKTGLAVGLKTCPLRGMEITNTFSNVTEPVLAWLENAPGIHTVIIMCRWDTRLNFSNSKQVIYKAGDNIPTDSSHNAELLEEGLTETCKSLRAMGKDVVLMGPVPVLKINPGNELRRRIMLKRSTDSLGEEISLEEFFMCEQPVFGILERVCAKTGARIVKLHPALEQNGKFRGFKANTLLYHDTDHLSCDGAEHVVNQVYDILFDK